MRRALPLRAYFAALFVLIVVGATAGAFYIDRELERDARAEATRNGLHSARTAAGQLSAHVGLLKATAAQLAANPQIANVLATPEGCTLTFQGLGGPDRGHLDIVRADGTVACSSRKLTQAATRTGYAGSDWLARSLEQPLFLAPERDALGGAHVAIASAPIPGGKGAVVAFADLSAVGPHLSDQYGGGRPTVFVITSADNTVIARSLHPGRWIGTQVDSGRFAGGGAESRDLEGTMRLYVRAPVAGTGWNVYVGEEKATVLASVERLRTRQLQLIAASLALLLLLGALTYRKVVTPIRRLSGSVRAASGRDVPESVPVSGPVEVRTLAEDVNALTAAVHRELHERRRAEASYRLLFESNPSPMWVFDAETHRFLAVNDAAIDAYGYSRDEFLGMTIEDIRPPEDVERLHSLLADPELVAGLRKVGIWQHQRKDGTKFDAEITSHDHRFEGRPARVVMALDVTERVQAEQALRRSEARYRDLFENASDLISAVDLEGRLTGVNEAFVRTTGYSREELIGKPLDELVPPEARAEIALARDEKLDGAETTLYNSELLARDGRRVRIEVASRLIYEDGQPVGTEAICRDITERLELEEQLRQAQRLEAIGRLAGGVAHDFNNLLTVISGYAQTLIEGRDDEDTDFALDQIAAAAERAAILTRQLLAFSRRQVLQPRVLQLNEIVEGITPMLSRLIGEDLELIATLEPELDRILADPNQIEQVLLNLAVNARDAMPEGGRLTIQTANVELDDDYVAHHGESAPGPHVLLAVSDTGTGMDVETLSHMFEPFFTTKAVGTGTGLGLATVYGIVKQSGGNIWVYSEPGKGTTFKIYLPVTEAAAALEAPRAARAPVTGSETILLAEDEEPLRRLTATLLERYGYVVISASSASEALRIAEENSRRIDLLLTDLIMPELSGAAVAERVGELVPGVKVLFMSGYADDIVLRDGVLTPGAAFLEKPFSAADLAAKVRETLDTAA